MVGFSDNEIVVGIAAKQESIIMIFDVVNKTCNHAKNPLYRFQMQNRIN